MTLGPFSNGLDCSIPESEGLDISTIQSWSKVYSSGIYGVSDVGEKTFNDVWSKSSTKILRRICTNCDGDHKDIYYRRITATAPVSAVGINSCRSGAQGSPNKESATEKCMDMVNRIAEWRWRTDSDKEYFLELDLASPSLVSSIKTKVRKDSEKANLPINQNGKEKGFSGLSIDVLSESGRWTRSVYTSNKMYGQYGSGGARFKVLAKDFN